MAIAGELHHLKGHVDFMLSDINTAMIICRKHQGVQNYLSKEKLKDDEKGNPNSQNVKNIKSYKNEYSRLMKLRGEINSAASAWTSGSLLTHDLRWMHG